MYYIVAKRVEESVMDVFEVSNNTARKLDYQVDNIAKAHLQIGVGRGDYAKQQCEAQGIERPTSHDRGQNSQLHS